MSSLKISQFAWQVTYLVGGVTLIEALSRPLFMRRSPVTQARYTTAFFLGLLTIAFVQWLRVSFIVVSHEIWSKEFYSDFSWWAMRLWVTLVLVNLLRLFFPTTIPLVFPLPTIMMRQEPVLALNRQSEFWSPEKNPCIGVSRRSLQLRGEVKIERTTPGLEDVPVFRYVEYEPRGDDEPSGRTSRASTLVNNSSRGSSMSPRSHTPTAPVARNNPPVDYAEVAARVALAEAVYFGNRTSRSDRFFG